MNEHQLLQRVVALVSGGAPESRALDYKISPYEFTEGGRKEFAKDASAFANSIGGLIVIGVDEPETGPASVVGVDQRSVDPTVLWLESVVRSWIVPGIRGLRVVPVEIEGKWIIVIDVPLSLDRPHEVPRAGDRFFVREERSVRALSREELRSMIRDELDLTQRIDQFVASRWGAYHRRDVPAGDKLASVQGGCLLVATPIYDQTFSARYPLEQIMDTVLYAWPMTGQNGFSPKPRIDGLEYMFSPIDEGKSHGHLKIYRWGAVELADGYLFDFRDNGSLPGQSIMSCLVTSIGTIVGYVKKITGAHFVRIDLRVKARPGDYMAFFSHSFDRPAGPDREMLDFDPIILEGPILAEKLPTDLRPLLDQLWQAYGYVNCGYFQPDGSWKLPR